MSELEKTESFAFWFKCLNRTDRNKHPNHCRSCTDLSVYCKQEAPDASPLLSSGSNFVLPLPLRSLPWSLLGHSIIFDITFLNLLCPWLTIGHVCLKLNDADVVEKFSEKSCCIVLNLYYSDCSFANIFLWVSFLVPVFWWHVCMRSLTRTVEILGEDSPLGIHVVPYCSSLSGRWVCLYTNNSA